VEADERASCQFFAPWRGLCIGADSALQRTPARGICPPAGSRRGRSPLPQGVRHASHQACCARTTGADSCWGRRYHTRAHEAW